MLKFLDIFNAEKKRGEWDISDFLSRKKRMMFIHNLSFTELSKKEIE